jgi:hypothetical protein
MRLKKKRIFYLKYIWFAQRARTIINKAYQSF